MEYNIRANTYKDFFGSALTISIIIGGIIGMAIFLNNQVDFAGVIEDLSEEETDLSGLGSTLIAIMIGMGVVLLLFNYLSVMNMKYILNDQGLKIKQPQMMVLSEHIDIKFDNIARMYVEKTLNNQILGGGNIVIELTGLKDKSVTLKSIDGAEQVMQFIMQRQNEHKAQEQWKMTQGAKIEDLLNKF